MKRVLDVGVLPEALTEGRHAASVDARWGRGGFETRPYWPFFVEDGEAGLRLMLCTRCRVVRLALPRGRPHAEERCPVCPARTPDLVPPPEVTR